MVLCVTAQNDAWHHRAPFLFPSPLHLSHQPHNNWALARCPGAFTVVPDASNIDKRNESRRRVGITQLGNAFPPSSCAVAATAAETIQVSWTTDTRFKSFLGGGGAYGPDGPWQAVAVNVGQYDRYVGQGEFAAMWPSGGGISLVLHATRAETIHTVANSSIAVVTGSWFYTSTDPWASGMVTDQDSSSRLRRVIYDVVAVSNKMVEEIPSEFRVNGTLLAMDEWTYRLPDSSNYSATVGVLGLGMPDSVDAVMSDAPPSILQQLKSDGRIASMSMGLHMGSVALDRPGSLVLGGYEQNRALGYVGVFRFRNPSKFPTFFLLDVLLGIQVGASPFAKPDDEGSIWQGTGDNKNAESLAKQEGLRSGTAVVMLNPAVPYIYLPTTACQAAARRLPVTWNARLGLYLWNTDDPAYQRIVRSPAYLGFVFADSTATNITIKVPFRLLNLTLEPPLMPSPTPYFQCKPVNVSDPYWMLGRAFLQAAFFGVDLERNVTYLAQAPGPAMAQSVVLTLWPDHTDPQTNPIEQFEQSWLPSWTVLKEDAFSSSETPSGSETPSNSSSADPSSDGSGALSAGSIAGIVVGVVAALAAAAVAVWFIWRRRAKTKATESALSGTGADGGWAVFAKGVTEMDGQGNIAELGKPNAHELWSPPVTHELPTDEFARHEFPGHDLPTHDPLTDHFPAHSLPNLDLPVNEG